MAEKDKDKVDEEIKKSRAERDAARADVMKVIEAHNSGMTLKDRIGILERAILKPMRKGWRHPITVSAFSNYHRCATCGGEFEDEVVVVVERTRSGDHNTVFCSKGCLSHYDGW